MRRSSIDGSGEGQQSSRQQYEAWTRRPALAESTMRAAVNAVQAAEKSGNAAAIKSALKRLMPAVLVAAQAPPPRCADPGSLYSEYLTTVYEAGYNARSAQGISNLLKAHAPGNPKRSGCPRRVTL